MIEIPQGISLEKPAKNLASLATTNGLRQLTSTVLAQWKHEKQFAALARYGVRPIDRLLFYGPPGNGKTMASQWLAQQLGTPMYRVRCESLIGSYLGQTATRLSSVMTWLDKQGRCVVLFDEVEQLFQGRGISSGQCARELSSAMTIFWQFLDRWEAPTLFVLATNLPDQLDAALLSRIDLKMEFGPPTTEQAESVIRYWQEVLHEFGGEQWGPKLIEHAPRFESFRELFQAVQSEVRGHIAATA